MTSKPQDSEEEEAREDSVVMGGVLVPQIRKSEEEEEGPKLWLITFTDIMALMLTFFVLMYSMSTPKEEDWLEMTTNINQGFSKFYSQKFNQGAQDTISIDKVNLSRALELSYLNALMEELIAQDETLQNIVLQLKPDRLIISFPHQLLFEGGQSAVNIEGQKALYAIGGLLSNIRNRIEVIGHADPVPIPADHPENDTNWDLSLERAVNVATILHDVGYARAVVSRGLSNARFFTLPETIPEERRFSLSRRVDLVIMKDSGTEQQFSALDSLP